MSNTNSTLSTIINEMKSTDNHLQLSHMIEEVISQQDEDKMTVILDNEEQFIEECEMYVWGQYVLHGSINQDSPIIGRNLYKTDDNITMVNEFFTSEIHFLICQFVETRLSYI